MVVVSFTTYPFFEKKKKGEGLEPPNDDLKKVSVSYLSLQQRPRYMYTQRGSFLLSVS